MTGWGEVLPLVVVGAVTLFGVLVVGRLAQARADREAMEARILAVVQLLVRLNTAGGGCGGLRATRSLNARSGRPDTS